MPCSYQETPDEIRAAEEARKKKLISPYKKELDKVTRLLCKVMTEVEKAERDENVRDAEEVFDIIGSLADVQSWWKEHKKRDDIREKSEARESVKKNALAKLTLEEKRILGLTK